MAEIEIESLTALHRKEYDRIDVFDDERTIRAWDCKRMPRFMSADHPAIETKTLYVRVPKADEASIRLVEAKIKHVQQA
jgi:hypothetical protein